MNILDIIECDQEIFVSDIESYPIKLFDVVSNSTLLVIGGVDFIGQAVIKEVCKRGPEVFHVVDITEKNVVKLVRDIRSTIGYSDGEFRPFVIDYCDGVE